MRDTFHHARELLTIRYAAPEQGLAEQAVPPTIADDRVKWPIEAERPFTWRQWSP